MKIWSSLLGLALLASAPVSGQIDEAEFMNPGMEYRPVPLWFWNNAKVETAELLHQFRQMVTRDGYGGCGILPFGGVKTRIGVSPELVRQTTHPTFRIVGLVKPTYIN